MRRARCKERHARQLDLPDASVEIAFDEGTIEAGPRQEVLSEIEIELKSGNAGALFDLGTQLLDTAPLQVGTRSKAERGYALAFDVALVPWPVVVLRCCRRSWLCTVPLLRCSVCTWPDD